MLYNISNNKFFNGEIMEFLARSKEGKVLKDDALRLGNEAKNEKRKDPSVVNGTLGTFYYEDGSFHTHNVVKKVFNTLSDDDVYLYSTPDGGEDFQNAAFNHLFRSYRSFIEETMDIRGIATPGGTGALVSSVTTTLDEGETLLIPVPCWGPYFGIAKARNLNVETFFMFDNDKFNINGFIEKANDIIKRQGKLVFFLNDPCNNPTGYTMTKEEMDALINYLNSTKVPCVLVYDCAYMDVASEGLVETREKLKEFSNANDNVVISLCLSYSKTYFIYGERLGAQIIIGKNKEQVKKMYEASSYLARNTWSNCNHGMISLVTKIDKDKSLRLELDSELEVVWNTLKKRSEIFLKEAKEVGLYTYPYNGGFFISIPVKKNIYLCDILKKEEKIYLLPVSNVIRVAICSISSQDLKGLAGRIKKVIDKYD